MPTSKVVHILCFLITPYSRSNNVSHSCGYFKLGQHVFVCPNASRMLRRIHMKVGIAYFNNVA